MKERLVYLDSIRGVAATLVLVAHFIENPSLVLGRKFIFKKRTNCSSIAIVERL